MSRGSGVETTPPVAPPGRIIKSNGRFYWGVWALASVVPKRLVGRGVEASFNEACAAAEAARLSGEE